MRNSIIIAMSAVMLACVAALFAPIARASRVSLLPEVEVRGNSIFLSDLLPRDVSASMRTSAQSIVIGVAPQPGSTRILDGGKLADLIGSTRGGSEIDIPRQIVVRRAGRAITREEVVAAIRAALKHSGLPDGDLQPEDFRVFPTVMVSPDEAPLEVRRIDFDETLNQAKFLLSERGALPFLVTAQLRDASLIQAAIPDAAPLNAAVAGNASATANPVGGFSTANTDKTLAVPVDDRMRCLISGALVNATRVQGPTLVQAGKAATLFLNSGTMQMLLDVTAIDRGSLHQVIRVRVPGTGKVLHAEVTGDRRLAAVF